MTRGSEYRALARNRKLSGVDPQLGQRLFRQVLSGRTGSAINIPMSKAEHVEYQVKTIPARQATTQGRVLEARVELSSIECLPFHKVRNTPTLPGAWILDLLVNAGLQFNAEGELASSGIVQDMAFSRFVRFANNQEPNVRVIAEQTPQAIDVWMIADVLHPSGVVLSKDVVCATARLTFGAEAIHSSVANPRPANGGRGPFVCDPYCREQNDVSLSGVFNCLTDIEISSNCRRAKFKSNRSRSLSATIPALLLDAAWRVGAMYAVSGKDEVYVPMKIGRMFLPLRTSLHSTTPAAWEIRSTAPRSENRDVRWDRTEVFDEAGRLKLVVEDALAKRLV